MPNNDIVWWNESEKETTGTDHEIQCPLCGDMNTDLWEHGATDMETVETQCDSCGGDIEITFVIRTDTFCKPAVPYQAGKETE